RADARRRSRDGPALPHRAVRTEPAGVDGADRSLEPQLPRHGLARGAAVRPVAASLPRVPAAARDGIERQTHVDGWHAGWQRYGSRDLGRAGLERAALILPAAAPGHGERCARLPGARECFQPVPATAEPGARELLRAGPGVRVRPDA